MTGLDHKQASLETREKFAVTKEKAQKIFETIKASGLAGGCVLISTCNRTELYASVTDIDLFSPSKILCGALDRDFAEFEHLFTERANEQVMEHLCRVASGLDSQIMGDDQIITQVREALELSRGQSYADGYLETTFKLAIQAAKAIKTNVILKSLGSSSIPGEAVEKLKISCTLAGRNAVVIGNGQMGRLVSELLVRENVAVTVTLREYKRGAVRVSERVDTICYSERYKAIEKADIVVSATTSPHFTIHRDELENLARMPEIIVDLAVPRDVEPSVLGIPCVTLLTIDDISREGRTLPPESILMIDEIITRHVKKYHSWLEYRANALLNLKGGTA